MSISPGNTYFPLASMTVFASSLMDEAILRILPLSTRISLGAVSILSAFTMIAFLMSSDISPSPLIDDLLYRPKPDTGSPCGSQCRLSPDPGSRNILHRQHPPRAQDRDWSAPDA